MGTRNGAGAGMGAGSAEGGGLPGAGGGEESTSRRLRARQAAATSKRAAAKTGSVIGSGARLAGRGARAGASRVVQFTGSKGAAESGLAKLVHLQFVSAAGDAAVAVSLAGTLFFTLPTDQARPQVAQFLLLTMAPFAIVAPFIGPFLDRFRHGRRWAIGVTCALRGFLCWVLADAIVNGSVWVFPAALGCLVSSKAFTVTRASAVPRLLPKDFTLVNANSRISLANVAGAAVGGGLAAAISQLGPSWSLRFAFAVFIGGTVLSILLPARVDSSAGERDIGGLLALPPAPGDEAPSHRVLRRFRSLRPSVLQGLRCVLGARLMTGFLTLYLAFMLREQPISHVNPTLLLGLVVAAAGIGNSLGTVTGNLLKDKAPERIGLTVLSVDVAMAIITAVLYGIVTVIAMGLVAGLCGQLAKLSYDALVQRDVPEVVRTSVFARSETAFQISWVIGGALGIILPLIPQVGFGVVAFLLVGVLTWTLVAWRRRLSAERLATDGG
ncbi:MFS transporter [Microlunatus panaciterrae]|uniref:MFS family permease n=1 Tax=Microlunatus panaciterrae TaxID=400768 RepID=A0ABS2RGR3_9ACTN|nr:MFS transporter [Microlunatus panaciterrae]MBM7798200.1 MFS family permease [Microlunatus panaciterrae]